MRPKISVYIASSLDGFIARKDGGIDWLELDTPDVADDEDYGFAEFIQTIDMILMGRHTFEQLLTFDVWIYGDTPMTVLSSTMGPEAVPAHLAGQVSIASGTPGEIVDDLAARGVQHVYVDGGITVQAFIRAGLVDEITITLIPVLIGDGIPLFGPLANDVRLKHVSTRSLPGGLVKVKYETLQ